MRYQILMAHNAKKVIVCNYDADPGYSGVENPLYEDPKTLMAQGDAKETMNKTCLKNVKPTVHLSRWYFCPHCQKRLFKGCVKTLKMICPNCNKLIDSIRREYDQKK